MRTIKAQKIMGEVLCLCSSDPVWFRGETPRPRRGAAAAPRGPPRPPRVDSEGRLFRAPWEGLVPGTLRGSNWDPSGSSLWTLAAHPRPGDSPGIQGRRGNGPAPRPTACARGTACAGLGTPFPPPRMGAQGFRTPRCCFTHRTPRLGIPAERPSPQPSPGPAASSAVKEGTNQHPANAPR